MSDNGYVNYDVDDGIGTITFFHPKSNSLPAAILRELAETVSKAGEDPSVKVVILKSGGEKAFCAGASFDELLAIEDFESGKEFFMGFARLLMAMRDCPKLVIVRVQGKAVGGGVGVAAAGDYTMATREASAKLSELALGIGPFVVGPAVERKLGSGPTCAMAFDHEWRDAEWLERHGLYTSIHDDISSLDSAINALAKKLAAASPQAMAELKKVFLRGTENWAQLLEERAEISGSLVLSDFTRNYIEQFKNK